jgi:hypothetical protein
MLNDQRSGEGCHSTAPWYESAVFRDDWVKRVIQELAAAIALAVRRAQGGGADDALKDLEKTGDRELGMPRSTIDRLEARSVLLVLGKERTGVLVQLLEGEAEVLDAADRAAEADKRRARAGEIRRAVDG